MVAQTCQDLFITCLFLNLFVNRSLINDDNLPLSVLMGMIQHLYLRVFKVSECPSDLITQVYHYHNLSGTFAPEKWPVDVLREALKESVCALIHLLSPSHVASRTAQLTPSVYGRYFLQAIPLSSLPVCCSASYQTLRRQSDCSLAWETSRRRKETGSVYRNYEIAL